MVLQSLVVAEVVKALFLSDHRYLPGPEELVLQLAQTVKEYEFVPAAETDLLVGQPFEQNLELGGRQAGVPVQGGAAELEVLNDQPERADQQRVDNGELV